MLKKFPKIFLTGATGWLGQRVAQALTHGMPELGDVGKGGCNLHCLIPAGESLKSITALNAKVTVGAINDKDALSQFFSSAEGGLLLHIAGLIHPSGVLGRTAEFHRINVLGTQNLYMAASAAGVKRIVVMSSNSPFGGNESAEHRFDENSPYNPYMEYGRSKWQMEKMLKEYWERGPEIVIVRSPWFYGPGQPDRQTTFFRMVKNGKFPLLGDGSNKRSMGYVDSLAQGLLLAGAIQEARNDVFWIADENPYSMREIIDTIKSVMKDDFGIKVVDKIPRLPSIIADCARGVDFSLQSVGLYQQKIHVLSEMNMNIACDINKAKNILKYQPLVEIREGMRRSIKWCMDNNIAI